MFTFVLVAEVAEVNGAGDGDHLPNAGRWPTGDDVPHALATYWEEAPTLAWHNVYLTHTLVPLGSITSTISCFHLSILSWHGSLRPPPFQRITRVLCDLSTFPQLTPFVSFFGCNFEEVHVFWHDLSGFNFLSFISPSWKHPKTDERAESTC